ncbi:MAG: hypothetical protein ACK5LV_08865 [Lachnospirales bacterium]
MNRFEKISTELKKFNTFDDGKGYIDSLKLYKEELTILAETVGVRVKCRDTKNQIVTKVVYTALKLPTIVGASSVKNSI